MHRQIRISNDILKLQSKTSVGSRTTERRRRTPLWERESWFGGDSEGLVQPELKGLQIPYWSYRVRNKHMKDVGIILSICI